MDANKSGHRWVGWRKERVERSTGPSGDVRGPEDLRLWRCSCGAEVYTALGEHPGAECVGSQAALSRHRF
jgi:hypothetical protein